MMPLKSPSSRGRGLKYNRPPIDIHAYLVALFTRAWIEMSGYRYRCFCVCVALFTRAWIEISDMDFTDNTGNVALFTRAWIEIDPN